MDDRTGFGQWLRARRREYGYTQEELARLAGCSAITLRRIEAGTLRPSTQLAELLAASLEVPPEERAAVLRRARTGALDPQPAGEYLCQRSDLVAHNVPAPVTSLVGRKKELATARALLRTPGIRLLTLTGPPGVGKTRTALALAHQMAGLYPDGVWFADLSPVRDPQLVVPAIARALDVSESGDASAKPLGEVLGRFLQDKELLLILDNFEQVVGAATDLSRLLAHCPGLRVLATSRIPLKVAGEHEYPIAPLSVPREEVLRDPGSPPGPQVLRAYEAVRLFAERAQAVRPDRTLGAEDWLNIAEICARLDGLPLPIELAAARTRMFSPRALLRRLEHRLQFLTDGTRDLPDRQRTLRSAIDWSYALLPEGEQQLFRRLAVFSGGRSLEAVEAVCGEGGSIHVSKELETLLEHSLLDARQGRNEEPRFWLLETIHEFAWEKMRESGEAENLQRAHCRYFMQLAEEADGHMSGPDQQQWLDRLEDEHDNLTAALQWASGASNEGSKEEAEDIESGLRGAAALRLFWILRGHYTEGRQHLRDLLAKAPLTAEFRQTRVKALLVESTLARHRGDYSAAQQAAEEALSLAREADDKADMANALYELGRMALDRWETRTARNFVEESLTLRREISDKPGIAESLYDLGTVAFQEGDQAAAVDLVEESLAAWRKLGNRLRVARLLRTAGMLATEQGERQKARAQFEESLVISEELGAEDTSCSVTTLLASMALQEGDYAAARGLLEKSLAMGRQSGVTLSLVEALQYMGDLQSLEGDHVAAAASYEELAALDREIDDPEEAVYFAGLAAMERSDHGAACRLLKEAIARAAERGDNKGLYESMATVGAALVGTGQPERATVILAAADALMHSLGGTACSTVRIRWEKGKASALAELGVEQFEKAWQKGHSMSMHGAVEYVLGPQPRSVEDAIEYAVRGGKAYSR